MTYFIKKGDSISKEKAKNLACYHAQEYARVLNIAKKEFKRDKELALALYRVAKYYRRIADHFSLISTVLHNSLNRCYFMGNLLEYTVAGNGIITHVMPFDENGFYNLIIRDLRGVRL